MDPNPLLTVEVAPQNSVPCFVTNMAHTIIIRQRFEQQFIFRASSRYHLRLYSTTLKIDCCNTSKMLANNYMFVTQSNLEHLDSLVILLNTNPGQMTAIKKTDGCDVSVNQKRCEFDITRQLHGRLIIEQKLRCIYIVYCMYTRELFCNIIIQNQLVTEF